MNLIEELQSLDINEPGRWPLIFRIAAVVLVFALLAALGIWKFVLETKVPELEKEQQQEQELRASFENKQSRAANIDAYKEQLDTIENDFGTMLSKLPGQNDVDDVLEDISRTAIGVGLEQRLFDTQDEIPRDFYAELPIRLRYQGGFHEIGEYISEVADLSRIVTLHNIEISPVRVNEDEEVLTFEATARIYRYLEED